MLIDSFFHEQSRMFDAFHRAFLRPRAVRYGILISHAGIDTLEELKAKAQARIESLQAYIEELEKLSESMDETLHDTETNEEAKPKAKAKAKRKAKSGKQAKG